jgi:flagellar hook assembly protein FlgD
VSLDHNRFNPLKGEVVRVTSLRADHGTITVMVYNPSGVLVRRVVDHIDALSANAVWDGRNDQNEVVASGVYLVVVTGNKLHKRFRIVVLK